ncbi:MAG: hypothetical protein WAU78_02300 [Roseiarcus sp.]
MVAGHRDHHRHCRAEAGAGEKAGREQAFEAGGPGREQAGQSEHRSRRDQDRLAAEPIGEHAADRREQQHANGAGAREITHLHLVQLELRREFPHRYARGLDVEALQHDDEKTDHHDQNRF